MSISSSLKLIEYLKKCIKEDLVVQIRGEQYKYAKKFGMMIHPSFFLKDSCRCCGLCCVDEETVFTQSDIDVLDNSTVLQKSREDLRKSIQSETIIINNCDRIIYTSPKLRNQSKCAFEGVNRTPKTRCRWLNTGDTNTVGFDGPHYCKIHAFRSVTCRIPHMVFRDSHDNKYGILSTRQYGRNWALQCPIKFDEVIDGHDIQTKINSLKHLERCAADLGVRTWLPEVIKYLEAGNRLPITFYDDLQTFNLL